MMIDKNHIAAEVSKTRDFFRQGYNAVHFHCLEDGNVEVFVKVWYFETMPSGEINDDSVLMFSTRRLSVYDVMKALEGRGVI